MTTVRRGRTYLATVARGGNFCLQGEQSDVHLQITSKCPTRAHLMEVKTDLANFNSIKVNGKPLIPDDECFIAPVVKVLGPAKTNTSAYILRIPHCLSEADDKSKVKVRMLKENRLPAQALVEVPENKYGDMDLYYEIDARYIELHTPDFSEVFCTICQTPLHCLSRATCFFFGSFESCEQDGLMQHEVEIRPYFCSIPYAEIKDFRQVGHFVVAIREIVFS